jgi:hypothetical protein
MLYYTTIGTRTVHSSSHYYDSAFVRALLVILLCFLAITRLHTHLLLSVAPLARHEYLHYSNIFLSTLSLFCRSKFASLQLSLRLLPILLLRRIPYQFQCCDSTYEIFQSFIASVEVCSHGTKLYPYGGRTN